MELLLDESIPRPVEKALEDQDIEVARFESGAPDKEVIAYAVNVEAPILTRDQGDFPRLSQELDHPGILIDRNLHLRRDLEMVSKTVEKILSEKKNEELQNSIWYLTSFYGR
ncbi:MAG: DUF5615 family PIN-like protein [Candidatus Nanohaloarchaea archaeon]